MALSRIGNVNAAMPPMRWIDRSSLFGSAARMVRRALLSLAAVCACAPAIATAQIAPKDGHVIGRILSFIEPGNTGDVDLGIVFAPGVAASEREAQALAALIGGGLPAGRVVLHARLIPLDHIARAANVAGLFLTRSLPPDDQAVAMAARHLRVPTISHCFECVRTARCTVGFTTEPTIRIAISDRSAEADGVIFTTAFRLLVKQY